MRYRIKTENQIEKDMGPNWRETVRGGWNHQLDELLGTCFELDEAPLTFKATGRASVWFGIHQRTWTIDWRIVHSDERFRTHRQKFLSLPIDG